MEPVTIIIPVRDDAEGLRITLNTLFATAPDGLDFRVIVANDGGSDAITAICAKSDRITEIKLIPNRGPGGARNAALEQTQSDYIAFLDADVEVQSGWWEALQTHLAQADYVAGRIDINPALIRSFAHHYDAITAFDVKGYMQRHHGATANLAVRKSLLDRIGGFDARFRSGEDTEFGLRAYEAGARMAYADAMRVLHPPRSGAQQRRKIYRVILGHLQLAETFPERFRHYTLSPRLALSLLLPPRKLAKERALLSRYDLPMLGMLYVTRWAARLYMLGCYVWLSVAGSGDRRHDLS